MRLSDSNSALSALRRESALPNKKRAGCFNFAKSAVPDRVANLCETLGPLPVSSDFKSIELVSFHFM